MTEGLRPPTIEDLLNVTKEGHGILELTHQIHQANRIVEWFETKL